MSVEPVAPPIMPFQCRQARDALGWTLPDLARVSGIGFVALGRFEGGVRGLERDLLSAVRGVLEEAGIEFARAGVRLRERPGEARS